MARNKYDIDEALESPFDIKHLKRAMVYVARYKKRMLLSLTLSALAVIIGLLSPVITQYALDVVIPEKNIPLLLVSAGLLLLTIVVNIIFSKIRSVIMTKVGQDIIFDIRTDLFEHLQKLSFEYYDSRPHGKILVRIINYINSVSDTLSNGIITFVLEIFNLIFIAIFMFAMSWKLALVILAGLPVLAGFILLIKNGQRRAWQKVNNKSSNLNAYLHEGLVGAKVTQLFSREDENAEIFGNLSEAYRSAWMKAVTYNNLLWPTVDTISTVVGAAIYYVGLAVFGTVTVSLGTIVAMSSYASRFWQPILNLANLFNNFVNAVSYLERIFETLDEPIKVNDKPNAEELPPIEGNVRFDNVTFAYDESKTVLKDLSFSVKKGENVALVGPTGAGKTTIVNLISRFYDVTDGAVLIDGHNVEDVTLKSLRSQMGIMLQDSVVFSGTIADNIRYGKLDATQEEITAACKTVRADEFIREFPNGYDTEITEGGSTLSQGQKQLIAFARTLISDPKILVLDEATSSIDAKTEKLLQEGLQRLLEGRTSFIIAHRLSTIRNCDKIMYVSDMGITECGTHEELLAKKGDYYKLYNAREAS
ncbi:MAG: ABC transporter ATP-binding protein/permease [Muribaculaceae bacterium]|nr:ABC transporter ATP-binding protein/permease [Muribaculaceae bacterium]MCM1439378.1 ABC transporter ATP-binding protein/permease [Roseburia sp.]